MQNFKKYYEKINSIVDKNTKAVPSKPASKGIVDRPMKKEASPEGKMSAEQQIARYVEIIRNQKKELLNGKA